MNLVHNERVKLLAANLDRLSTACLVVGVLGKTLDFAPGTGLFLSLLVVFSWILSAIALHMVARRVLGRLEP